MINLFWSGSIPRIPGFQEFLQKLANRAMQGHLRYGPANKRKKYLDRIKLELRAYCETGNYENLLNIAVYCYLESDKPQNKKFHFDNTIKSVTRGRIRVDPN